MNSQYPRIDESVRGSTKVWTFIGEWTRDRPLIERREVAQLLSRPNTPQKLILDLTNVSFLDSWGEESVCDSIQGVQNGGGLVVWVFDVARVAEYEGLVLALQCRKLTASRYPNLEDALQVLG